MGWLNQIKLRPLFFGEVQKDQNCWTCLFVLLDGFSGDQKHLTFGLLLTKIVSHLTSHKLCYIWYFYCFIEIIFYFCWSMIFASRPAYGLFALLMIFIPRFGETPFKRSIESPSAWKSPWFLNSFLPGPRVDTDITIEVAKVLVFICFLSSYTVHMM